MKTLSKTNLCYGRKIRLWCVEVAALLRFESLCYFPSSRKSSLLYVSSAKKIFSPFSPLNKKSLLFIWQPYLMEYFLFPFGAVGRYGKYGSLGDSQGYAAWWHLSQNVDCACPPKAAVRERHHLNHAVVPIRVPRAVWIGWPWLDGYPRSLKLQEPFFNR